MVIDRNKVSTVAQGQAGVYRVLSELILQGLRPCIPAADDHGVDILLESGIKIQVKCSHLTFRKQYPNGAYWFGLRKGYTVRSSSIIKQRGTRKFSTQVDFLILFGITEGNFWIVPAEVLDNVQLVVVGPETLHQQINIKLIHELRAQGMEQQEIADKLGTTQMTVSRRLRGIHVDPQRSCSAKVRLCEGRWDLIHELVEERKPQGQLIEMPAVESAAS